MLHNYVDTSLDDNLICCICRTLFNEPVTTRTCFHTFCRECILQALSVSNHCPIDRSPLSVELLGQADPIVRHLVEELTVRCPYLDAGCEYTGERHLLESHLKLQCPYIQVPCPCSDGNCKRTVARKDAVEGEMFVHQETGPESDNARSMICESCEEEFPSVPAMEDHLVNSCPEKIVPCRQVDNGCTWRGRRASFQAHTGQCPYESIKGFFAIHSTQMAKLSKDNERLQRRTNELEGTVRILRQELEWAKVALGPWYRPVYPERPPMSANHTQWTDDEGSNTGSAPGRVGPVLLRTVDLTSGTSRPEPGVENGATETLDLFDPFSFITQRQNRASSIHVANNVPTATSVTDTDSNTSSSANANSHAAESARNGHNLNGDATYDSVPSGPGSSNGSGSIHHATGTTLPPVASNPQSTSTALFSDHFPSEDRVVFGDGSPSPRPQGWQPVSSPPNSTPLNPSPGIHSPNQPPVSSHIHSHLASSHPFPCNRPQFMPSINKHVVAPLNLSTTIEGSLIGLRESLVTLSAALESQGRRLELALTTEGLRVSEEVGSLKATVQGLRMQVYPT
ncbi:hypothetical protein BDM02DRAFT_2422264 [Thelephora ganbajun]|uniref:Uncharacterized protein n=1 Tax=Thelephora ganbajun TaxID=370292 RepID=A0ACB6ZTQ1_THEGA|nr:hypothetical protein BDM02DRAFT_2422264 [Thelephora ganbajun]